MRLRGFFYSFGMKQCGRDFQVAHDVKLLNIETISAGNNSYVAYGSILIANPNGEIIIGNQVMIGPQCVLVSDNHTSAHGSYRYGQFVEGNIIIEDGAWVGAHCTILLNSKLPSNSCLGANSVLNRSYDTPNSIYVGQPAHRYTKSS
ncbi:MAG: acyltransferase [Bacilli bacterium]|nr:acyltransferase [Bacilli bacterium]